MSKGSILSPLILHSHPYPRDFQIPSIPPSASGSAWAAAATSPKPGVAAQISATQIRKYIHRKVMIPSRTSWRPCRTPPPGRKYAMQAPTANRARRGRS
jgi:hypothetical protein